MPRILKPKLITFAGFRFFKCKDLHHSLSFMTVSEESLCFGVFVFL